MAKKPELSKPDLSKTQMICIDALNDAVTDGDISQIEADPMIAKCNEPLTLKA
jgi:hypothetical protein